MSQNHLKNQVLDKREKKIWNSAKENLKWMSVFENCWRAGKIDESKPGFCRPLIVQMTDIDAVNEWTRDGKGLQLDSGYWVNKDLCMADRRANFLARQERRKRLKNQSQ